MFLEMLLAATLVSERGLFVREHVEHFDVRGRSYRNFYDNLSDLYDQRGSSRAEHYAHLSYYLEENGQGQCRVGDVEISLDLTYRLPQWERYERANRREQEEFDELYETDRTFLEGYGALAREHLGAALREMRALPVEACEDLPNSVEDVFEKHTGRLDAASRAYRSTAGEHVLEDTRCQETGSRIPTC